MTGGDGGEADAELLDRALESGELADLPERLLQLAAVATELAGVLASPVLSPEQRRRILVHAQRLARRRTVLGVAVPRSGPVALAAGAGGAAAVTIAVIGIALLRRSGHAAVPAAEVRTAA
ncbi:MAG TPA: hypothetical protein VFO60_04775 [Candidatus Dormibacteraeota bacterium]|nr:hypothetical protein [Candidatus Dormibacteraeota bacterium]